VRYIDPHIHMVSRTTDDYHRMALAGCVAVSEPAFWAGFDRSSPDSFRDYFRQLTEFEGSRAAQYGIRHYAWVCINAKEAENVSLAREVIALLPEFLDHPRVLGVGEIGLNKNTKNEAVIFQEQVELALRHGELILVHTPHLEDKYKGTRLILDMLADFPKLDPEQVLIDHVEEHTIRLALDQGYWIGMTLYPTTKCTPRRAADMVEAVGPARVMVNSAADWGPSDPLAVPEFIMEMRRRGHEEEVIQQVVYDNPLAFFSRCRRWVESVNARDVAAAGEWEDSGERPAHAV